jgi:LysR family transcriptional regulator for metE and metH
MVATSRDVTVLPSWLVSPYVATSDIATVAVGAPPQHRTWYSATRHDRSELVDTFVSLLHAHLGGRPPVARTATGLTAVAPRSTAEQ